MTIFNSISSLSNMKVNSSLATVSIGVINSFESSSNSVAQCGCGGGGDNWNNGGNNWNNCGGNWNNWNRDGTNSW